MFYIVSNVLQIRNLFFLSILLNIYSTHFAQEWIQIEEVGSQDVYAIAQQNDILFAVTKHQIFVGDGIEWNPLSNQPKAESGFQTIYSYQDKLYVGTFNNGIFVSTDSGNSWSDFSAGLSQNSKGIIKIAGLENYLFVGTADNGIQKINLNGGIWQSFNTGLIHLGTSALYSSGSFLLAGVGLYSFIRKIDDPAWTNIPVGDNQLQQTFHDFIKVGDHIFAGTENGVYRTSEEVLNWQKKDIAIFPSRDIACFVNDQNRIYAGIDFGLDHWIFYTDDFGETWNFKWHEFSFLYDLIIYDKKLWAARLDGLWYYDLSGSTNVDEPSENIPNKIKLSQNYPNPFNPLTKIKYEIPKSGRVKLIVYNALGVEIQTLLNEFKTAGVHEIKFDASDLSSGIYFYELRIEGKAITKKMVLLR